MTLTVSVIGQSITETEEYQLERQATALKQAGDWSGAIDCLKKVQVIGGSRVSDTRLAKYLQQAGRYEEAMQEIQRLIHGSLAWSEENFGHQPRSVRRCQQAGQLAQIHDDAALICKREKCKDLQAKHKAEAERWWVLRDQLKTRADHDKKIRNHNRTESI